MRRAFIEHLRLHKDTVVPGLQACGYRVMNRGQGHGPGDYIFVWNRNRSTAKHVEAALAGGAEVVVMENGFIGRDAQGGRLIAVALDHHAGAGRWHVGEEPRWQKQGIELQPWRKDGRHVLILAQRGIGEPGVAMPHDWPDQALARLKRMTSRPCRIRFHPGKEGQGPSLTQDLKGAWCAVTWASGAAMKALCMGIPVFHDLHQWVGAPAARPLGHDIEDPFVGDREPMLHRMSWAQWSVDEVRRGEPFRCLMK